MNANNENVVGVSSIAKNVRILLVDPNTTSLMLLATQLEQKQYKVTTTESAIVALSMFRERKSFYNVVLADYHMQEMSIFVFVQKIRRRCPTTPVLLMATDTTVNIATDAILKGACFFFTKPLRNRDVTDLWQHVVRMIGKLPDPLDDTRNYYLDILRNRNPSDGGGNSGGVQNRKWWNSKRKSPIREYRRRGKNHVLKDLSDSSESESDEEKENIKRPRMCWTPSLHARFLQAIDILGEEKSYPKALLKVINEPGLTHRQVASHLQKHRDRKRKSVSPNAADERQVLLPIKLPTTSVNENFQGRNIVPIINHPPAPKTPSWLNAPSVVCYNVESIKQKLDTLHYPENCTLNDNRGVPVQVSEGDGTRGQLIHGNGSEAQPGQGINQNYDKSNANEEQVPWFSQNLSHIAMTGDNVIVNPNPNQEQAEEFSSNFAQVTMTCDNVIPYHNLNAEQATRSTQNSSHVIMSSTYMIPTGNHLISGSNILNQESTNNFGMGLSSFENSRTFGNFGEGADGANQRADISFEGMTGDFNIGDINQIIQDVDAYGVNLWNTIN